MTALRRPGVPSATVLLGLAAGFAAAHLLAPDWSRRAGLDVWNLPSARAALVAAAEEREEVVAYGERSARRREAANQIATQLAVGRVTLSAAADQINEVFRDDSGMSYVLVTVYPEAPSPRHRFALHAIERVRRVLSEEPDRAAGVLACLQDEYRTLGPASAAR
jgi:hypothetical protein